MRTLLIAATLSLLACTAKAESETRIVRTEIVDATPAVASDVFTASVSYELKQAAQDGSEALALEIAAPYPVRYTYEAKPLPVLLSLQETPAHMPLAFPFPENARAVSQIPNHRVGTAFLARHNC